MFRFFRLCFGTFVRLFCSQKSLLLENLALRQQLSVLKHRHPRPRLNLSDRLFWLFARQCWSGWKQALLVVTPETVVRWHRAGFCLYWKLISRVRKPTGRTPIAREVRDLIFQMVAENPTWGAPRIHGELLMLGFDVSERTISRWMKRAPRDPGLASAGLPFFATTRKPSPRLISLRFPRSRSAYSIASSSSATNADAFCTSTSPSTPLACGSSSNCAKPFPLIPLPGFCFSIAMPSTDWKSRSLFAP